MVKLGNYKGLKLQKNPVAVSAEEVENAIQLMRQSNTRSVAVDRDTVEQGDIAVIDYEGFADGVPFEGGKGEGYALEIGSGTFIPGFEEGLIGAKVGEDVDVKVTFPEAYHSETLSGKEAVFKCKVNEIQSKEIPELDVQFVKEVSEFETVEDFRADVKKNLMERKEREAAGALQDQIVEKLIESSEIEVTEEMITHCINDMVVELAQSLKRQGMSMEMYMQFTGLTEAEIRENLKPQADKRVEMNAVLKAVAEAENLEVTEKEYEDYLSEVAAQYHTDLAQIKASIPQHGKEEIMKEMTTAKALDFMMEHAEITE